MSLTTMRGVSVDYARDLGSAKYVIMLERYTGQFGVHTLKPRETGDEAYRARHPFHHHTVGLFKAAHALQMAQLCTDVFDMTIYDLLKVEDITLHRYIGAQVIPLEWKHEYSQLDSRVTSRIWVIV